MIPLATIPTIKSASAMPAKGISTTGLKPLMLGTQHPQSTPGQEGPVTVGAVSPNAPVDPNAPDPNAVDPAELQKSQAALQKSQADAQKAQLQIAQHKQEADMAKAQAKQVQAQAKHQQQMMTGGDVMHKTFMGQKMEGINKALSKLQADSLSRKFSNDSRIHTGRAGAPVSFGDVAKQHGVNPDGSSTIAGAVGDLWNTGKQVLSHPKDVAQAGLDTSGYTNWANKEPHADWRNSNNPGTLNYYGRHIANAVTNGAEQVGYGLKQLPGWFANQGAAAANVIPGAYHAGKQTLAAAGSAGGFGNAQISDLARPWAEPAGDALRTAFNLTPGAGAGKLLSRIPGALTSLGFDALGNTLDRTLGGEQPAAPAAPEVQATAPNTKSVDPNVLAQIMQWAESMKSHLSGAMSNGVGRLTQMAHSTLPSDGAGPHSLRNPYYLR